MPALGAPELMIILVIIILFFGAGKLSQVGSELGKGIREFRSATRDADSKEELARQPVAAVEPPRPHATLGAATGERGGGGAA